MSCADANPIWIRDIPLLCWSPGVRTVATRAAMSARWSSTHVGGVLSCAVRRLSDSIVGTVGFGRS